MMERTSRGNHAWPTPTSFEQCIYNSWTSAL